MAQEAGNRTSALMDDPSGFDLFAALRLLECRSPDRPRIGESVQPAEDLVRLGQRASLRFAPASIADYRPSDGDSPVYLEVHAPGLLGPNGPLPLHVTETVQDRIHNHRDRGLAAFLDIFNHRMLCLFYRAWASSRQCASHDRAQDDRFASYVASCIGAADPGQTPDARARLHSAGRLLPGPRNAEGLKAVLEEVFGLPVAILELAGQWVPLDPEDRCCLGRADEGTQLGKGVMLGGRCWQCQHRFSIRLGPMDYQDYLGDGAKV